jgi:hypothetical protein
MVGIAIVLICSSAFQVLLQTFARIAMHEWILQNKRACQGAFKHDINNSCLDVFVFVDMPATMNCTQNKHE